MSREPSVTSSDARAHRRWLIGIGITLVFGLFGAIMALLAYTKLEGPAPVMAPRRSGAPAARPAGSATQPPAGGPALATPVKPPLVPAPVTPSVSPAPDKPKPGKGHD